MKLYKIYFEVVGGEEYMCLVAGRNLTDEQVNKYIVRFMHRHEDKHFEESEIQYVEYKEIDTVKTVQGHKYEIKLFKQGGFYEFIRRFNITGM